MSIFLLPCTTQAQAIPTTTFREDGTLSIPSYKLPQSENALTSRKGKTSTRGIVNTFILFFLVWDPWATDLPGCLNHTSNVILDV
jgi:hypothetical protein